MELEDPWLQSVGVVELLLLLPLSLGLEEPLRLGWRERRERIPQRVPSGRSLQQQSLSVAQL